MEVWYFMVVLFLVVLPHWLCTDISPVLSIPSTGVDVDAGVILLSPNLFDVIQNSFLEISAGVVVRSGTLPERSFLCLSFGAQEQCTQSSSFYLQGPLVGTFVLTLYLKSYPDEASYQSEEGGGGYIVLSSMSAVVDMAHHESLLYQHTRQSVYQELFTYLSDMQWEHIYIYSSSKDASTTDTIDQSPIISWRLLSSPYENEHPSNHTQQQQQQQLLSPPSPPPQLKPSIQFPWKPWTHDTNAASYRVSNHQSKVARWKKDSSSSSIVFFVSNVNNILNSNRFKDWLCDADTFRAHSLRLLILAPFNEDTDSDSDSDGHGGSRTRYCNVDIIRFAALSIKRAAFFESQLDTMSDSHPDHLDIHFLTAFLSEETRVLLLVNTFGDPQTSLLLKIITHLRSNHHPAPSVLMDLPNLTIPPLWVSVLDGLIAPSRAVGMHASTTSHGLPIAVIYPPMRDSIMENSVCHSIDSSSSSSSSNIRQQHFFTFLYIGRLATEKQPGLLIKAVLYILSQQHTAYVKDQVVLMNAVDIEEFRRSIKIIICGDGELMEVLRETVTSVGLDDVIVFEGHVDHEQLRHVIQQSDVLINPIVKGETFGFNHVEASSHGLPVIAFDMMANRETIATGVFIEYERGRLIITLADAIVETYLHFHHRRMSTEERMMSVMKTCASARSMYRHWNSRQHSLALISLLNEIIITG